MSAGKQERKAMRASPKAQPSSESPGHSPGKGHSPGHGGVRYITDDLIKKVSGHDHLPSLTTLNLTLSKDGGKKIKYIENLEKLKKLTLLNLSYNTIERIEKLDRLTLLKDLNLSFNSISKIEGLETLKCLQTLNLTGNRIEHIPSWIGKNLKALRVFKIAKNQLQSLHEFSKLRPVRDLSTLTVAENPVCQLSHCRLFLVYHLTTLEILDSQVVTEDERRSATDRFSQVELERLEEELESKEMQIMRLKDDHDKSLNEISEQQKKEREITKARKEQQLALKELERELGTKNDLLKRKTGELMVASQKHYELEQELAFYKIDHKFGALSKPPEGSEEGTEGIDSVDLFGESPYIGKGRFQGMQRASRGSVNQEIEETDSMQSAALDSETRAEMHAEIDRELMLKRKAVEEAQERLENLMKELSSTEQQISQANKELFQMAESAPGNQLTEDDKQEMRKQLAKKIGKVHYLRGEVGKTEDNLSQTEEEIRDQEMYLGRLKGKMRRMGSKDPLFGVMKKEMGEREKDLRLSQHQYQELHAQLQDMLFNIAQETDEVKKLEAELREGLAFHNDEMKAELEGIVHGLQTYLSDVQHKADCQRSNFDALVREKAELSECLRDLEADASKTAEHQAGEVSLLRERLALLEDSLVDEKELNDSLRHQLDESRAQHEEDADASIQLKDAQEDIDLLRRKLADAQQRAEVEQAALRKKLEVEDRRVKSMREKAKSVDLKEDEIHNLQDELAQLQQSNAHLQDQLYAMNERLKEEKSVDPCDLRSRLENVTRAIRSGAAVESPREDADEVDEALNQMQKKISKQINRNASKAEEAQRERDKAKEEVNRLKEQVLQVQMRERKNAELAIQAMVEQEKSTADELMKDLEKVKRELDKAQKFALEKELEASRLRDLEQELREERKALPAHLLEASPQATARSQGSSSSTTSGETGSSSSTDSTIPSSQWPQKKKELYESMTQDEQDLFDELQEEIEELRRLLLNRDHKEAAEKANQAEDIAKELRDLMQSRRSSPSSTSDATTVKRRKVDAKVGGASKKSAMSAVDDAVSEIDRLRGQLQRSVKRSSRPADVPPIQLTKKDEVAQIRNHLEDQKGEIQRLNQMLERLTAQENPPLPPPPPPPPPPQDQTDGRPVPTFYPPLPLPAASQPPTITAQQHQRPYEAPTMPSQAQYALMQPQEQQPAYNQPPSTVPAPDTPVAVTTPVNHSVSMVTTPGGAAAQPIMMSTPVLRDNRPRGILKSREAVNVSNIENVHEEFVCNVPQHHDLEDYVSSLQSKVKKLKAKLKDDDMDSWLMDDSGRRVAFDDHSIDARTVRHLQAELEERRTEMESLDLAVERQKRMLEAMRSKERSLAMQKRSNVRELRGLGSRGDRRRAFLKEEMDYDIYDEDYDYEYIPRTHSSRQKYLQDEILCLEKTLAKRRSELRESDRLLRECDEDLVSVRKEAKKTIEKYEVAKMGVSHSMKDAEEIERRAREAGKDLIQIQEEVEMLKEEAEDCKEARQRDEQMLQDIQKVIALKDTEFQNIQQQIVQGQTQLSQVHRELLQTANSHQDRVDLMQDSGQALDDRRKELDDVRQKIQMERRSLEMLVKEKAREMSELEGIHQDIARARAPSLDSQEDAKRKEDSDVHQLKSLKLHLENDIKQHELKLKKVRDEIEHEEEVLQNLATLTNQQKCNLREIEESIGQKEKLSDKLTKDSKVKQADLHDLQNRLLEDSHTLDTIQTEVRRRSSEVEHLRKREENERAELEHLQQHSNNMAAILNDMKKEKTQLEETLSQLKQSENDLESKTKIQQQKLQRVEKRMRLVENAIHSAEGRCTQLNQQMHSMQTRVKEREEELSELQGNVARSEVNYSATEQQLQLKISECAEKEEKLHSIAIRISECEEALMNTQNALCQTQNVLREKQDSVVEAERRIDELKRETEAERQQAIEQQRTMLSLEQRIENLGQEIASRDREKFDLASALENSVKELNELRNQFSREVEDKTSQVQELHGQLLTLDRSLTDREKELQYYREKSANEIADLEGVAQTHYSRANRLSDELEFLRAEHAELKAQINAQREQAEKERLLENTLLTFKEDLKEELTGSLMGLEKSRADAVMEAEQLSSQKLSIEDQLGKLKLSLSMIRSGQSNPLNVFVHSDRNNFAEQQAFLKQQLQQKMSRHVESMRSQRELSQSSIQHLQDKLKNLEKTLSSSSESKLYRKKFSSQMPPNKDPDASTSTTDAEAAIVRDDGGGDALATPDSPSKCEPPPALCPPSPLPLGSKRAYSPNRHSAQRRLQSPSRSDAS